MHTIVYSSEVTSDQAIEGMLENITSVAKKNNPKEEITGILFFHNQRFLQVIEGPKENLLTLLEKLKKDSRHHNLEILIDEPIPKRSFGKWNMDSFNLDAQENFNLEHLKEIRDLYKSNFTMNSDVLVMFFKKLINEI